MLPQQNLMMVIVITSIAALGTLVGSIAAYYTMKKNKPSKNALNFIIALGGGLLFSAIALILIPEGTRSLSFFWGIACFFCGSVVFMWLDVIIEKNGSSASQILANTMDSIPESLGMGAAFAKGGSVGLFLAFLIGLQNIAEGFNSFNEMKSSGMSTKSNLILQTLSSLSGPIAGILGFLFLAGHPALISALFMFSAGGILYLIFHDIAPLAHRTGHWIPTLGSIFGFILGLLSQALVG
jgi:ZIP family zinc transporter